MGGYILDNGQKIHSSENYIEYLHDRMGILEEVTKEAFELLRGDKGTNQKARDELMYGLLDVAELDDDAGEIYA